MADTLTQTYDDGLFLIGRVCGEDDYRLGVAIEGTPGVKWAMPDGQDVSFTREELAALHELLGTVLAISPRCASEVKP